MEREVSPDSSTHFAEKGSGGGKTKKRKHKHRDSKRKHHKSSSEGDHSSHSKRHLKKKHSSVRHQDSDEEISDIKPLAEYVDDKKELHRQIFSILPKKEIKNMLPDILKNLDYKELKRLCLEQLEVMSQKRLRHIIAGEEMMSSSSDESGAAANQEAESAAVKEENVSAEQVPEPKEPDSINILQDVPNQEEIDELVEGGNNTTGAEESDGDQAQVGNNESAIEGNVVEGEMEEEAEDDALVVAEAELMELEFRARALKSMVRAREMQQKPSAE